MKIPADHRDVHLQIRDFLLCIFSFICYFVPNFASCSKLCPSKDIVTLEKQGSISKILKIEFFV